MTIEFSCGLPPGPDFSELAVLAETVGYSRVWIFDSAPLWEDPFVHLALAAEHTSRIGLGTHRRRDVAECVRAAGTVLYPGEARGSVRVRQAVGPWQVVHYHEAYAVAGAAAVDAMPGGRAWREALEEVIYTPSGPEVARELHAFYAAAQTTAPRI